MQSTRCNVPDLAKALCAILKKALTLDEVFLGLCHFQGHCQMEQLCSTNFKEEFLIVVKMMW